MIKFFNTLTRKKENFRPIKTKSVKIYSCGPTVYDRQHIGNLRSAVIWDILRRTLEFNGLKVRQVVNITDFGHLTSDADSGEDKMTKGLKKEGLALTLENMKKLGEKYAKFYLDDRKKLNTLSPFKFPFASEHISEDIEFIKKLEKKGCVYILDDGVYFETEKFPAYGKLGGLSEIQETRIGGNQKKKNPRDFVLWKMNEKIGWDSPWGKGFPGWHIECSVMSEKYLGKTFDIHTGGIEHIPIHHNNEIAQSESVNGKKMANFWMHNEHLIMPEGKMAKSLGNTITLTEIEEKGFDPLAFRYWLLGAHYRSPISFSWDALEASQTAFEKIKNQIQEIKGKGKMSDRHLKKFKEAVNDDLNTPKALAILWEVLKDESLTPQDKKKTVLEMDKVFGLGLATLKKESITIPSEVKSLVEQREKARREKNWGEADRLRSEIEKKGFEIKDTNKGPVIKNC